MQFIQKLHSGWAYIALLLLLLATINSILGFVTKKEFTTNDKKIALFALIALHLQLVIGLATYFTSALGLASFGNMKNPFLRLTSLEHPVMAILAIVLVTIGFSKHKKLEYSTPKHKILAITYTIALVLVLSKLPWSLWL